MTTTPTGSPSPADADAERPEEINTDPFETTEGATADIAAPPIPILTGDPLQPRSNHPFRALGFRNFRLFFFGQMISMAGTWMQGVAEQWLIFSLTHSSAWLGIVSGASALPYVAFAIWGGQVADRLPRRSILIWTQTVPMIMAFLMAILATNRFLHIQPWHIVGFAVVLGVVRAFNMPAQQAFVTDMVEDRKVLGNAISLNSFQFNIARIVGPILAGWLLIKVGVVGCFTLNGLSFIAVIASLMAMRLPPRASAEPTKKAQGSSEYLEGLRYIRRTPTVLRVILLVGAGSMLLWSIPTIYPPLAARFGEGAKGFTQMMAANGVGAACGGIIMATFGDRLQRRMLVYGGAFLFGITSVGVAFAPTYPIMLFFLAISGLGMMTFGTNSNTRVQEQVPDALRGRVMAVYSFVFGGLNPLGGLEIGFVAQRFGPTRAVLANAALALVITFGIWVWSRLDPRRTAAPEIAPG